MDYRQLLKKSHLFSELDDHELTALDKIVSIRHVSKGEILFFQGDLATGFYVLLTGRIRVYKASPDGKEYTLHLISPGQMFAEAAVFRGPQYPANCAALEDSTIAFLPKDRFLSLVENSPQISLKMIGGLVGFVREFNQMVEDLSLKGVPARLASFLLNEYNKNEGFSFLLEVSKSELARRLGTVSETLSRNLKRFRESGWIRVAGKEITILDPEGLRSIADSD
jgi:CRP/FNR family transcriptional regulator